MSSTVSSGALASEQVIARKRGGPAVLQHEACEVAPPGAGQLRIRMQAAGVAFADLMLREGVYPVPIGWPRVPGYDVVGEIESVGPQVPSEFRVGQRVAAMTVYGSYARHRLLDVQHCVPVPEVLASDVAAALILNYLTAYQMLTRVAILSPGDTVLVHSLAGGLGSAVLDLARPLQLRVIGFASPAKHDYVRALGGEPIDHRNEDVDARIAALTGGRGVDAVLDAIGGAELRRSYGLLKPTGMLISFGALSVAHQGRLSIPSAIAAMLRTPKFSGLQLLQAYKGVYGYNVQGWRDHRPALYRQDLAQLLAWAAAGTLTPSIAERVPLAEAARAQQQLGEGGNRGKLILI